MTFSTPIAAILYTEYVPSGSPDTATILFLPWLLSVACSADGHFAFGYRFSSVPGPGGSPRNRWALWATFSTVKLFVLSTSETPPFLGQVSYTYRAIGFSGYGGAFSANEECFYVSSPTSLTTGDSSGSLRSTDRGPRTYIQRDRIVATPIPDFLPVSSVDRQVCIPFRRDASVAWWSPFFNDVSDFFVSVSHSYHSASAPLLTDS